MEHMETNGLTRALPVIAVAITLAGLVLLPDIDIVFPAMTEHEGNVDIPFLEEEGERDRRSPKPKVRRTVTLDPAWSAYRNGMGWNWHPQGMTWDPKENVLVISLQGTKTLYKATTAGKKVGQSSFSHSHQTGVACDGKYYYVADYTGNSGYGPLIRNDKANGNKELRRMNWYGGAPMVYADGFLYYGDPSQSRYNWQNVRTLKKATTNQPGNVLKTINTNVPGIMDIAFDGKDFWILEYTYSRNSHATLHRVGLNGVTKDTFKNIYKAKQHHIPSGLAYSDGSLYLFSYSEVQGKGSTLTTITGVGMSVYADNAALLGKGEKKEICYSKYQPYTVSVNITSAMNLNDASEVKTHLDYNTTNATLSYNWTRDEFKKSQDPDEHVILLADGSSVSHNGKDLWFVNFSVMFDFSFPHEKLVDCMVNVSDRTGEFSTDRFPGLFRVENDLEFEGTPEVSGEYQGELEEGDWVRGGEGLTVRNLTVHYEGAPHIVPDDKYFDVRIEDTNGEKWWDNESGGAEVFVNFTARNESVPDEEYSITIVNIPGNGYCATNFSFPVKIDAHAPLPPASVRCVEFEKEAKYVNTPSVNVTWDAIIDNGSGLLGYYYSQYDNMGTDNGTFTEETEGEIEELDEGIKEVFVWAVDNVGNIGSSANSNVLIDRTAPTFRDFLPTDGSWHNHTKIECSVDILDTDGSGVDPESVSYAISTEGPYAFGPWVPVWVSGDEEGVRAEVKNSFNEGEENYIKWRAKDLSGNGFTESSPVNLKIDITPLTFSEVVSPEPGWYDEKKIVSALSFYDHGSGVDFSSLEARVSTSGENEFGPWMEIREENVTEKDDGFELTFAFTYAEGDGNFLMFGGTDNVTNPFSYSRHFNYRIDTRPVYFANFDPPSDEFSDEKEVECLIDIYDDGIGVEPESVEYSVSTGGEKSFGAWKRAYDVSVGNPTTVRVETEFDWGRDNFIRFRADDKMANGVNISVLYNVWVNSEPDVVISFPPNDGVYTAGDVILFDASNSTDIDGDILSFFWTSNVMENASLGNDSKFRVRLAKGNHTIILHVDDGHEYNVSEKIRVNVGAEEKGGKESGGEGAEQKETLGESGRDLWLWVIIALSAVSFLIILGIVLLIRIRRKTEKEAETSLPVSPHPAPMPYPQGQYVPDTVQSYQTTIGGRQYGQYGEYGRGGQPSGIAQGQVFSRQQDTMGQGAQQTPVHPPQQQRPPSPPRFPPAGQAQYTLPSFPTDKGQQDLNRPALPPAPESILTNEPVPGVYSGTAPGSTLTNEPVPGVYSGTAAGSGSQQTQRGSISNTSSPHGPAVAEGTPGSPPQIPRPPKDLPPAPPR